MENLEEEELGRVERTWRQSGGQSLAIVMCSSKCILLDPWLLPTLSTSNCSPEETLFSVVSSMPETVWYLVGTQ